MRVRQGVSARYADGNGPDPLGLTITLSQREVQQLLLEVERLQIDARIKGPILDHIRSEALALGHETAPYPGHPDVWPRGRRG